MDKKLLCVGILMVTLTSACASSVGSLPPRDFLGSEAAPSMATRIIEITPETSYVNVTGGEIIRFVAGGKSFAWSFNGANYLPPFDLQQIAPPGVLDHQVVVYAAPNPMYIALTSLRLRV